MSDFVQTMKDWRRMCNTMKSCNNCPMQKEDGWTYTLCSEGGITSARPEVAEKVIVKWAAEHPEPVYPTWGEWLAEKGELCKNWKDIRVISSAGSSASGVIGWFYKEIPADIARVLGIEPKEDIYEHI